MVPSMSIKGSWGGTVNSADPGGPTQVSPEAVRRATKWLAWLSTLQFLWLLVFVAGGGLLVWTAERNGQQDVSGCGGLGAFGPSPCVHHHSYVLPLVVLAAGLLGFVVNAAIAAQVSIRYLGYGAMRYIARRRRNRFDSSSSGAFTGFPGLNDGGLPPGTPGSSTGPPL
jgi:hypothetical protein